MKLIAYAAAGLVAATALTPVPAEAQRYGYDYGYDRSHRDDYRRDYRHDRHGRDDRYRGHGHHSWRDRSYTRCHYVRGYYGRQRQCYRVYR